MGFSIEKLVKDFLKFPSIGMRVATRFAFYVIKMEEKDFNIFINNLIEIRKKVKICSFCFNVFEPTGEEKFCFICLDKSRDKNTLCVIEKESDLEAIEKTKKYNGLYFILGGTLSVNKKKKTDIRIKDLVLRIEKLKGLEEIIIATNFTTEGEATSFYVERKIKELNPNIKITRLSRGMPTGGELEYADTETIEDALLGRK